MINNKKFYQKSVKEYGVSAQGVHWNDKYTQYKRFEVLTKFIKKQIKSATIIDAGCGFGEYYRYLLNNNLKPNRYIGYDCENMMISQAQKRFVDIEFYIKDILYDNLEIVDYYVCSGGMNLLSKEKLFRFISRSFQHSQKGFVFNLLSSLSFNNIDIDEVLGFCSTLTQNIKTKDRYLHNDVTIFMIK